MKTVLYILLTMILTAFTLPYSTAFAESNASEGSFRIITDHVDNYVLSSNDGMIDYTKDGTCGYIDEATGEIRQVPYEYAGKFYNGYAIVQQGEFVGVIDKNLNVVIPVEYDRVYFRNAVNGSFPACKIINNVKKWGIIDFHNNTVLPFEYDSYDELEYVRISVVKEGDQYGLVDTNGNYLIPLSDNTITKNEYDEGFTIRHPDPNFKHCWLYQFCNINAEGNVVLSDLYNDIFPEYFGLKQVRKGDKYGYIDLSGKIAIPLIYDDAENFYDGLASVKKNDKWGFISINGESVIDFEYDLDYNDETHFFSWDARFQNGLSMVCKEGKFGIINKNGDVMIPIEYDLIEDDYGFEFLIEHEIIRVQKNGLWGLSDINGNLLTECMFSEIQDFHDGYAFCKENDSELYSIINMSGEITAQNLDIAPEYYYFRDGHRDGWRRFTYNTYFSNGLAAVQVDGKWGYINASGKFVIEPWLDEPIKDGIPLCKNLPITNFDLYSLQGARDFNQYGFAKVYWDDAWNIIYKKGYLMLNESWNKIVESEKYFICENDNRDEIITNECELVLYGENGSLYNEKSELLLQYDPNSINHVGDNIFSYRHEGLTGMFIINKNE